ncbi:antibiotic biosynthesis monooxygenase family protein [Lysobacter yangpyeongensis]|uniref:Antibiotic biosynthesis monooxygenase family protein n=1 Tax=Lysobacter yangpyeongensis TaxID=346182 RepID=A0ABW0SNE3_9GAMM
MFVVVWEYEVRPGSEAAFSALYGADGDWVALFREHAGYLGTELLRDAGADNRFVTIDRWRSQAAYEAFLATAKARYAQIDARGDALTTAERRIGWYSGT